MDAHATVLCPNSSAFASATATTRSLNELVGLRVSSLIQSSPSPSSAARRSARTSGVQPAVRVSGPWGPTGSSGGVAPDARRAGRDRLAGDRPGDRVVVVGDLERAEAPFTGEDRRDLVVAAALAAPQSLHVCHAYRPLRRTSPSTLSSPSRRAPSASSGGPLYGCSSVRHWHLASTGSRWNVPRWKLVAAASQGLSLGRSR